MSRIFHPISEAELCASDTDWHASRDGIIDNVPDLAGVFRDLMRQALDTAYQRGALAAMDAISSQDIVHPN